MSFHSGLSPAAKPRKTATTFFRYTSADRKSFYLDTPVRADGNMAGLHINLCLPTQKCLKRVCAWLVTSKPLRYDIGGTPTVSWALLPPIESGYSHINPKPHRASGGPTKYNIDPCNTCFFSI